MANRGSCTGYKVCDFIDMPPSDFLCPKCKCVNRAPTLTNCCGDHFCRDCITPYKQDKQPCPSCGERGFDLTPNKRQLKKILSLKVYCSMRSRGCKWIGEVEGLEAHMHVETGDCMHITVQCPSNCGQEMERGTVKHHLAQECPLRDSTCHHCNFKASYKVVSEVHLTECPYYPIQCPNKCGVTCERETLKDHINICSKEKLVCSFSYAGCEGKFLREDEEKHMEKNSKKHLSLLAATTLNSIKENERLLKEEKERSALMEAELRGEIAKIESKCQSLEMALKNRKNEDTVKLNSINAQITELQFNTGHCLPPATFTMPYFYQLKQNNRNWYSPTLYTSRCGYNFLIVVCPNGSPGIGRGTHVSILYRPKPGDFDEMIKWPVTVTVTIQLLNQHADKNHITVTASVTYNKGDLSVYPLKRFYVEGMLIGHDELGWNAEKESQYLKNDCLRFKIETVVVLT